MNEMFCFQCQETLKNSGCTTRGICGKPSDVANLQDLLVYLLKGVAFWGTRGKSMDVIHPETNLFVAQALFSTITNANFDTDRFILYIKEAIEKRNKLKLAAQTKCNQLHGTPCPGSGPDWASWEPKEYKLPELLEKARQVGVMSNPNLSEDIRSLRELIIYGLKGMAAYTDHAYILDGKDDRILEFMQEALEATTNDEISLEDLINLVLKTGEFGIKAMALLDKANTESYGNPEPTQVDLGVKPAPGILVSGHDLLDLEELLEQTEGTGIYIYTHGEMLPANAYPLLKKHQHLAGNYGGSWWHQREEFESFGGPILMTTNCIVTPKESYKNRLFTSGMAGYPGCQHIPDRVPGKQKDFSTVISLAMVCEHPKELENGKITIGFAHESILKNAGKIIESIQSGKIKRFVVMGGCDGRQSSREYFTEVAEKLPSDTIILTAGCAKYRYNKMNFGEIDGIPRLLDAGQCNDSYSLIYIAKALADALNIDDINNLPISYDIAWYEQKAVIVLLGLLSLGVRNIKLGPTLPAFLSPNVISVLVENFNLQQISSVNEDLEKINLGI